MKYPFLHCADIIIDQDIFGGRPVIAGTRFPLYQVFAKLACGYSLDEIADKYDLDIVKLESIFKSLAAALDNPPK